MEKRQLTIGQISDRLKEPPARVAYVIAKKRIKPIQRVGIIRLFDLEQLETIKQELCNLQKRRSQ